METEVRLSFLGVAVMVAKAWRLIDVEVEPADFEDLIRKLAANNKPGQHDEIQQCGWGHRTDQDVGVNELGLYQLFDGGEVLFSIELGGYFCKPGGGSIKLSASGKTYELAPAGQFLHCSWSAEGGIVGSGLDREIPDPAMIKPQLDCIESLLGLIPDLDEIMKHNANGLIVSLIHERLPFPKKGR